MNLAPHPFSLRQLQYVVAVADTLSFGGAAARCHVSQPSLSAQVALLEDVLGARLFERDRRRVLLTVAGREIVERARAVLREADDLVDLARATGNADDPVVRRRLAEIASQIRSLRALGYKGFASFAQGSSAPEHSFMKLATSELRQQIYELGMDLQGPGLAITDPRIAPEGARWQKSWMTSLAATIGGGTSEIQRNVIASRVLGLPRG